MVNRIVHSGMVVNRIVHSGLVVNEIEHNEAVRTVQYVIAQ